MQSGVQSPARKSTDGCIIEMPSILETLWSDDCCIYRIPKNLRNFNEAAYNPQLISIGPIHYGGEGLADMEKHKSIYVKSFLDRTKIELLDYANFVKTRENDIRGKYLEIFRDIQSNKYVKMFLWDAFFIFELFLRVQEKCNQEYRNDHLLHKVWIKNGIQLDLILLENQLPYSDLRDLYNFAFHGEPKFSFFSITCEYFKDYNPLQIIPREKDVLHFTDLIRRIISLGFQGPKPQSKRMKNLRGTAKKLSESGIKFKGIENGTLADVKFEKGELKLPQFKAFDSTERVYRNLMAFEQCQYQEEAYICSFILLMDFLVNSAKDVTLLVENGVILDGLGSDQAVADMVNMLCRNIADSNFYFQHICDELNRFCDSKWRQWVAILNGVYFCDIWHGTGTVVGIIVLVFALINSVWNVMKIIGVTEKK